MSDLQSILGMDPVRKSLLVAGYVRNNALKTSIDNVSTDLLQTFETWIPAIYEEYDLVRVDIFGYDDWDRLGVSDPLGDYSLELRPLIESKSGLFEGVN